MSDPDIFITIYGGDYLKKTGHLSTLQHGAYFLMILNAWHHGGKLPVIDDQLRQITKMDKGDWKRSRDTLLAFWHLHDGAYRNKRIDEELAKARTKIEQKSFAGHASVAAKKNRVNSQQAVDIVDAEVNGCSPAVATATSTAAQRQFNSSPSPSKSEESKKERTPVDPLFGVVPTPPVSAKALPQPRGSRLQNDWQPTESDLTYAVSLSLDPGPVADEFRFYWTSVAGKAGLKLNWSQAFKGHCLRQSEQRKNRALSRASPANQPFRNGFAQVLHEKYNKPHTQDIFATKLLSRNEDEK